MAKVPQISTTTARRIWAELDKARAAQHTLTEREQVLARANQDVVAARREFDIAGHSLFSALPDEARTALPLVGSGKDDQQKQNDAAMKIAEQLLKGRMLNRPPSPSTEDEEPESESLQATSEP